MKKILVGLFLLGSFSSFAGFSGRVCENSIRYAAKLSESAGAIEEKLKGQSYEQVDLEEVAEIKFLAQKAIEKAVTKCLKK